MRLDNFADRRQVRLKNYAKKMDEVTEHGQHIGEVTQKLHE
jgi:hypothetical protein